MRQAAALSLLFCSTCVLAQSEGAPPSVEISASRDRARQQDSAAITVVGRAELLRFGDQSVGDALRRLPGITVGGVAGRGGEIRMRGLGNGYTRLLLDGQPTPAGFAIDSISPEQIERIEVLRVATAESGAQAIAGTINIVLRKSGARAEREFKLAQALSHERVTPDLSEQWSSPGEHLAAALGVVAVNARSASAALDGETGFDGAGLQTLRRSSRSASSEHRPTINLTPRLSWTFDNGDTLVSQNFIRFLALRMASAVSEQTSLGAPTSFPINDSQFNAHTSTMRNELQWLHQLEQGARLELQLGRSHFRRRATNDFEGHAALAADDVSRIVDSGAIENTLSFSGKYRFATVSGADGDHALMLGWDAARGSRAESRYEYPVAADPGRGLENTVARLLRLALYLQDDWTVTAALSLSLGARFEVFDIDSGGTQPESFSRRLHAGGPLLQARLATSAQGQLRVGLSRTFKLPPLDKLAMRRYTVDNDNSPLTPDQQGNPGLLPERAWGLDGAYEHYFDKNSMASASLYLRRISDVTITGVEQRGGSWIATPINSGRAEAHGIEFEAKTTLAGGILKGSALRLNAARNWSHIASLPGPNNGLPEQAPFSAGAGIDRRFTALPLTIGANFSVQGGARWRQSARVSVDNASQRDLSLVAQWRLEGGGSWRLSASNLLAQRHDSASRYRDGAGGLRTLTATPTWSTLRLAYEGKL